MKKIKFIVALTTLFILTMSSTAFALGAFDIPSGEDIPSKNIERVKYPDGTLRYINYVISSTGATSGIRYRTSAVTVNVGGQTAVIDISSLGSAPTPGEQQFTRITISKQDILKALPGLSDSAFNNPEDIQIGAHIQIWNAGTGEVLATITNKNDVASVAGAIGFGKQDIADMESRFLQDSSGPVILPEDKSVDQSGVRPSILVK